MIGGIGRVLKTQRIIDDMISHLKQEFGAYMKEINEERNEYERRFQSQLVEIANMQKTITDLQTTIHDMKTGATGEEPLIPKVPHTGTPEEFLAEVPNSKEGLTAMEVDSEGKKSLAMPKVPVLENKKVRKTVDGDEWRVSSNAESVIPEIELQHTIMHDNVVCCVEFSKNGSMLASGGNRAARVFDAETGKLIHMLGETVESKAKGKAQGRNGLKKESDIAEAAVEDAGDDGISTGEFVRSLSFSPDGRHLAAGAEDKSIKIWELDSGSIVRRLTGHRMDIYSLDYAPNAEFIVSGSGDESMIIWDTSSNAILQVLKKEGISAVTSVSVSPDSKLIASGSIDRVVRVWETESGRLVHELTGHKDSVYSVSFSPDGTLLISGSSDNTLALWDLTSGNFTGFFGHQDYVLSTSFFPDGRHIVSGSKDMSIRLWDIRNPVACAVVNGHENSVLSVSADPSGGRFASGSGDMRARIWTCDF